MLFRSGEQAIITPAVTGEQVQKCTVELMTAQTSLVEKSVPDAIARGYHWTIAPCGDVALNKLGLSTQVPVVWSYISDGPYRKFAWDNVNIEFKHRTNRQISFMSESTTLVVEAIKTLGKERIDEGVINNLKNRVPEDKRKQLLEEATGVSEWIYEVIRKVCLE